MRGTIRQYQSWGRLWPPATRFAEVSKDQIEFPREDPKLSVLPFGNGRSYGDSCLNEQGLLLDCRPLKQVYSFDPTTGVMRCGAGILLDEILRLCVPSGWFLPVTPGTKFITLGGAIANDVHGKNHHRGGTFGRYVTRFELLRSDGNRLECSPTENDELFRATIGGLGLTGLVIWAEITMSPLPSRKMEVETLRFSNIEEFFSVSSESDSTHEHTVAWIDCLARKGQLGRGRFFRGNHVQEEELEGTSPSKRAVNVPFSLPFSLANGLSVRVLNALYYHWPPPKPGFTDFEPFFYPLDRILNWNRLYGPNGFYQFQCALPWRDGQPALEALLEEIAKIRQGSFLAVLKIFGDKESPGFLSFPRPGPTLALDFPNRGRRTRALLRSLESIVLDAGGALYPAKDAVMSPEAFERSYPNWRNLEKNRDPLFCSSFWRRVTGA